MLKIFENFEIDNSKIWIIGVPSGEALFIDRNKHDELYRNNLITYSIKYSEIGFFIFDDKDRNEIIKSITKKIPNDYMIFNNQFNDQLIKMIKTTLEKYPFYIKLYVSKKYMEIRYEKCHITIKINETNPKYKIEKRNELLLIDNYNISTDKFLIKRLEVELNLEI